MSKQSSKRNEQWSILKLLLRSLPYSQFITIIAEMAFIISGGNLLKYEWQSYEQHRMEANLVVLIQETQSGELHDVSDLMERYNGKEENESNGEDTQKHYNVALTEEQIENYCKRIEEIQNQLKVLNKKLSTYTNGYGTEQLRIVTGGAIKVLVATGDEPYRMEQETIYEEISKLNEELQKIQYILYSTDGEVESDEDHEGSNQRKVQANALRKYQALIDLNDDFYGWLTVPGTVIDLPVVTNEDNEYYLDRDFYKEESRYGTLFLDCESRIKKQPRNLIIYGHNMMDGSMFHDLLKYKDKSFYEEHKTFTFDTIYGEETYEVISAFYSKVYGVEEDVFKYYKYVNPKKSEMEVFVENIKELSRYDTGVEGTKEDIYITLSTCAYHTENGRFVVIGKRVES